MGANDCDLLADGVDDELRLVEFDVVAAPRCEDLPGVRGKREPARLLPGLRLLEEEMLLMERGRRFCAVSEVVLRSEDTNGAIAEGADVRLEIVLVPGHLLHLRDDGIVEGGFCGRDVKNDRVECGRELTFRQSAKELVVAGNARGSGGGFGSGNGGQGSAAGDGVAALGQFGDGGAECGNVLCALRRGFDIAVFAVNEDEAGDLGHVKISEDARVVAAEGMADEDVWGGNAGGVKRRVKFGGDLNAGPWHGAGIAEAAAGAIIAAGAGGDGRLDDGPGRRPVFPARVKDDGWRSTADAIQVDVMACDGDEATGMGVEVVAGRGWRGDDEKRAEKSCQSGGFLHGFSMPEIVEAKLCVRRQCIVNYSKCALPGGVSAFVQRMGDRASKRAG